METEGRITEIELRCCNSAALKAFQATFPSCAGVTIDDLESGPERASAAIGNGPQDGRVEAAFEGGEWVWIDLISYTSGRRFHFTRHSIAIRFGSFGSMEAANLFLGALPAELDHQCRVWRYENGEVIGRNMTISEARTLTASIVAGNQ